MDGSSDVSPFHCTEQDTSAVTDEASGGMFKHLHQVQKARKKNRKHQKKRVKERVERSVCDLKRQNAEILKEIDDLKSKAAEMNKQMTTEFSNEKNRIANQENLVETFLQEPLVQQLLGANKVEAPLLGNRLDGTGGLKDRAMMLKAQIDWLCQLFVK